MAFFSLASGVALCVAVVSLVVFIQDRLQKELRSFGANFVVEREEEGLSLEMAGMDLSEFKGDYFLPEKNVPKITEIFWKNNILGFVPLLPLRVRLLGNRDPVILNGTHLLSDSRFMKFQTDIFSLNPNWNVRKFEEPAFWSQDSLFLGISLAEKLKITGKRPVTLFYGNRRKAGWVAGTVQTGGKEDFQVFSTLAFAQPLSGNSGKVRRILVSALTTPEHKIYERLSKNPKDLPPQEFEKWYCTPFPSSIAYQLREVFPHSRVSIVRKFAETEGAILLKMKTLLYLVFVFTLVVSATAIGNSMVTAIRARKQEIGLLKTMGAKTYQVMALFLVEGGVVAFLGGCSGWLMGVLLSFSVQHILFSQAHVNMALLPVSVLFSFLIACVGSIVPVVQVTRLSPVESLKRM